MGVDYYTCAACTFGYRDDSDYCVWCECGNGFCSAKCGKLDNCGEWNEEEDTQRVDLEKDITCIICRSEQFTDFTLLNAVLKHFKITREQAINIWRMEKKDGK